MKIKASLGYAVAPRKFQREETSTKAKNRPWGNYPLTNLEK